jgi:type II secretory pathway component PulF
MLDRISHWLEWQIDAVGRVLEHMGGVLIFIAAVAATLFVLYSVWYGLAAGLRRHERTRCFLDLLEIGLRQGRRLEDTVASLARTRLRDLGVHFHLLAARLERGERFGEALAGVPRLLDKPVRALLRTGDEIGDVARVLPACRAAATSPAMGSQVTVNQLGVMIYAAPVGPFVYFFAAVFILPKLQQIGLDMGEGGVTVPMIFFEWANALAVFIGVLWGIFALAWGVPDVLRALTVRLDPATTWLGDWCDFILPWRRNRMIRNFSTMLALLLDGAVPEARALRLAATATGNRRFLRRAERAAAELAQGRKLTEVVEELDDEREFAWRLANAAHAPTGFGAALAGWHEALEARAFAQEQVWSQIVSTSFVLLNGALAAMLGLALFGTLIQLIQMI